MVSKELKLNLFLDIDLKFQKGEVLDIICRKLGKAYNIIPSQLAIWYSMYKNSGIVNNS